MADPKKNPLIGAFRAPVPGAPPDTPAPPEAGKGPCGHLCQACRWEKGAGGPQDPCGHYSQAY